MPSTAIYLVNRGERRTPRRASVLAASPAWCMYSLSCRMFLRAGICRLEGSGTAEVSRCLPGAIAANNRFFYENSPFTTVDTTVIGW